MTALLLLLPGTPMLFQGQEFAASAPFLYFADFEPRAGGRGAQGPRASSSTQFPSLADLERDRRRSPIPATPTTFERCKLDLGERETHAAAYALHAICCALRREDAGVPLQQRARGVDGAVLAPHAFALRFFTPITSTIGCSS